MRDNKKIVTVVGVLILLVGISAAFFLGRIGNGKDAVFVSSDETANIELAADVTAAAVISENEANPTEEVVFVEAAIPTPKTGLASTDPSTVNLASGEPQLVELFAFW